MNSVDFLTIRLINDIQNPKKDDVIKIGPSESDQSFFEVCYTMGGKASSSKQICMKKMSIEMTRNYIQTLFFLLPLDDDGYTHIQVDLPCLPGILVQSSKLPMLIGHILHYITSIHSNWPTKQEEPPQTKPRVIPPPIQAGARRHLFFDEEGGISHIQTTFYE